MTDPADPTAQGGDAYRTDPVASQPEELKRIMSTGTVWSAAGMIAPALVLGPLLASGWRPVELEFAAFIVLVGRGRRRCDRTLPAHLGRVPRARVHPAERLQAEGVLHPGRHRA